MDGRHKLILVCFSMLRLVVFVTQGSNANKGLSIDLEKTKIWGPGLNADVTLPARYFFIQPVTKDGEKITESLGDNVFTVSVTSATGENVRYKHTVYGRRDGLYIVVYRLYNTIKDATIEITYNEQHVAQSPYLLEGTAYHEQCNCPHPNIAGWFREMGCPTSYRQIEEDMSIFPSINNEKIVEQITTRYSNRTKYIFSHYKIINNNIFRKIYGDTTILNFYQKVVFADSILLSILRKVRLSDTEFVMYLSYLPLEQKAATDLPLEQKAATDLPLEQKAATDNELPLLSWCGFDDTWSIVLPTFDLTLSSLEMLGRYPIDIFSVMGKSPAAWENKTEKGFWRGRDSNQARNDLVVMSTNYPELIDAKFTKMFNFHRNKDILGELVRTISLHDFFMFKYQINVDGSVAAFRLPYLLSCDGVVLKQESPFYEHFYKDLKPYKHYIPVRKDLQDLTRQIKWAKENDDKAREISRNAQDFTMKNVDPLNVLCYYVNLFEKYTSVLTAPISPPEGNQWEVVAQPDGFNTYCDCKRTSMKQTQKQQAQQQTIQHQKQIKQHQKEKEDL